LRSTDDLVVSSNFDAVRDRVLMVYDSHPPVPAKSLRRHDRFGSIASD
jgi:hypothetical protein